MLPLLPQAKPDNMNKHPTAPGTTAASWLARIQPGLFAIPFGLMGLASAWQKLVPLGITAGNPASFYLFASALALFTVLLVLWLAKLARHPAIVRREWQHPVQGALTSLIPLNVLLTMAIVAPLAPGLDAVWLPTTLAALLMQGLLAWQVVARLSSGQMPGELVTPALYLPTVAGGFVGSITLNALGMSGWAALLVGMGAGAWALLEMRILYRLFAAPLPLTLRPTLGMEIAPAAVGSLALANLWPALPAEVLVVCLGVASGPVLAVLTRWRDWTAVPFSAGFWSFSFPLAAMAGATVEAVRRGGWPPDVALAAVALPSLVIGFLAVRTLMLLARGRLLPPQ